MFQRILLLGFQLLLALASSRGIASAQDTIHVCGADLRIGMAKDRVLEIASADCELNSFRTRGSEVWCARPTEKNNSGLADYEGCHLFQFAGGVLILVNKHISEASGETVADLMNKIYEFTTDAKAGGRTIVIEANQTEIEKQRHRTISFTVGDRSLVLNITQPVGASGSTSSVSLIETLAPLPKSSTPRQ